MKVNFKSFKRDADVEKFLEGHLTLGAASPDEVTAFLKELGLQPSALDEHGGLASGITPSNFESMITCSAPARPTYFLLENSWFMWFLFTQRKLVRIVVRKYSVGL